MAALAGVLEGHDVSLDVLTSVASGRGGIIQSTYSMIFVERRWRGMRIASMTGARLWAI